MLTFGFEQDYPGGDSKIEALDFVFHRDKYSFIDHIDFFNRQTVSLGTENE